MLLLLTVGLLAFRGYATGIAARPTDNAPPAIDLNTAGPSELQQVPGIGPALARKIDEYRREKGPFKSVDELRQVRGVGPATLDKVRPFLRIDPAVAPAAPQSESAIPEPLVLERRPATSLAPQRAPYPRQPGSKKLQPGDPPINVNAASVEQLMQLPGVGVVTAQNIVVARAERPLRSLADLDRVKGIGAKTLEKIKPFVVFE